MEDQRTYKFAHCEKCGRQLIVPKYDGWTGRELPETTYICAVCHEEEEKKLREQHQEFVGTITWLMADNIKKKYGDILQEDNCKISPPHAIPCEICKAVYGGCEE